MLLRLGGDHLPFRRIDRGAVRLPLSGFLDLFLQPYKAHIWKLD
jgi:hypothetical protein